MDANGTVGVAEAAMLCGVSDDTIRRRIWDGSLVAKRDSEPNGPWRITLSALVAAGLRPQLGSALPEAPRNEQAAGRVHGPGLMDDHGLVAQLRAEIAEVRARAARAEALAEARAEQAAMLMRLLDGHRGSSPQQLSLLTAVDAQVR